jgi:hypothetical protein
MVVLPAPVGPNNPITCPASTCKSMPRKTELPPRLTSTPRASRTGFTCWRSVAATPRGQVSSLALAAASPCWSSGQPTLRSRASTPLHDSTARLPATPTAFDRAPTRLLRPRLRNRGVSHERPPSPSPIVPPEPCRRRPPRVRRRRSTHRDESARSQTTRHDPTSSQFPGGRLAHGPGRRRRSRGGRRERTAPRRAPPPPIRSPSRPTTSIDASRAHGAASRRRRQDRRFRTPSCSCTAPAVLDGRVAERRWLEGRVCIPPVAP